MDELLRILSEEVNSGRLPAVDFAAQDDRRGGLLDAIDLPIRSSI
jgi:hypothetical protein